MVLFLVRTRSSADQLTFGVVLLVLGTFLFLVSTPRRASVGNFGIRSRAGFRERAVPFADIKMVLAETIWGELWLCAKGRGGLRIRASPDELGEIAERLRAGAADAGTDVDGWADQSQFIPVSQKAMRKFMARWFIATVVATIALTLCFWVLHWLMLPAAVGKVFGMSVLSAAGALFWGLLFGVCWASWRTAMNRTATDTSLVLLAINRRYGSNRMSWAMLVYVLLLLFVLPVFLLVPPYAVLTVDSFAWRSPLMYTERLSDLRHFPM